MNGATVFQMVSGLGSSFGDAYSAARKDAQDAEAPAALENLYSALQASRGDQGGSTTLGDLTKGRAVQPAQTGSSLPTFAQGTDIGRYASAIQSNESGGKYGIVGPTHPKYGRALGAYQVMESNLPSWSREALGREVSADEFLRSPQIQDAIFQKKFGQAVAKYGNPEDAASVWFTGRPLAKGANAKDVLGTTGAEYVRRFQTALGRVPAGTAPALPQTAMQMPPAGGQAPVRMADAPPPEVAQPRRSSVAVAENEAETQSLEREMGMVPGATQVATAEPDAANMPAVGAQPVGFTVPGAGVEAPSQAFSGFGAGASKMTPELRTALNAAWKNPSTRAVAAQVFGQLLKGQDNGWELKDVNGQSAWVNGRDGRILPIGQAKRNTATVGNNLVDTATGEVLFTAPDKDSSKFTYQAMPGVGMVALHSTDPTQSRVIIAGQQPRPLTAEERQSYGIPEGTGAGMGADGKPFDIGGGGKTTVNVDTKGAGKFAEKANELQAKRYGDIVDASDNAVRMRGDVETLAELGSQIATGKGAQARLTLAQYAQAIGLDSVAQGLTGGKLGEMEAFGAIANRLTPQMRIPGSGATSDMEMRTFRNSIPNLIKTPEGNKIVADTFRGLLDYQGAAGEIAAKALRGEMAQAEADQAIRALPSPFENFKGYQRARKGASADPAEAPTTRPTRPTYGSVPVPMDAVRDLRGLPDTPENRSHFDDIFGEGAANRVLGRAKP